MKARVALGKRPEKFVRTVEFVMLDGQPAAIECSYKYRTREEFGALLDSTFRSEEDGGTAEETLSMERHQALTCKANGEYLHAILVGWNLDTPFSLQACVDLANEVPAAAQAVMDAYRQAVVEGRLGN